MSIQGIVKKLVLDRGFGFLERSNGRDVFFHANDIAPGSGLIFETMEGEQVLFEIVSTSKGDRAADIRPAWNQN